MFIYNEDILPIAKLLWLSPLKAKVGETPLKTGEPLKRSAFLKTYKLNL